MSGGESRLMSMLGLCRKAGRLAVGSDAAMKAVRCAGKTGGASLVIIAADASARTEKQFNDKCAFYGVPALKIPADCASLGRAAGKISPAAVCAVTDKSLAEAVKRIADGKEQNKH